MTTITTHVGKSSATTNFSPTITVPAVPPLSPEDLELKSKIESIFKLGKQALSNYYSSRYANYYDDEYMGYCGYYGGCATKSKTNVATNYQTQTERTSKKAALGMRFVTDILDKNKLPNPKSMKNLALDEYITFEWESEFGDMTATLYHDEKITISVFCIKDNKQVDRMFSCNFKAESQLVAALKYGVELLNLK